MMQQQSTARTVDTHSPTNLVLQDNYSKVQTAGRESVGSMNINKSVAGENV